MSRPLKNTDVVNIKMPAELKKALQEAAAEKAISTNDLIRAILSTWLKSDRTL